MHERLHRPDPAAEVSGDFPLELVLVVPQDERSSLSIGEPPHRRPKVLPQFYVGLEGNLRVGSAASARSLVLTAAKLLPGQVHDCPAQVRTRTN